MMTIMSRILGVLLMALFVASLGFSGYFLITWDSAFFGSAACAVSILILAVIAKIGEFLAISAASRKKKLEAVLRFPDKPGV